MLGAEVTGFLPTMVMAGGLFILALMLLATRKREET